MANLIITVIAIALVAIASLMGAYYGGSAFLNSQSAANASTVLNEGQQIAGAWNAYLADNLNAPPTTSADLLAPNAYLAQIPSYPAGAGGTASKVMPITLLGARYFTYADMGTPSSPALAGTAGDPNAAACDHIIKTAVGGSGSLTGSGVMQTLAPGAIYNATIAGTASGNNTFGCAYTNGATAATIGGAPIPAGHYVMEYVIE